MRQVTGPRVDTLRHPLDYDPRQVARAVEIAKQGEALGGVHGFVCGEYGLVLGVDGDRGVLVLAEPPRGEPA